MRWDSPPSDPTSLCVNHSSQVMGWERQVFPELAPGPLGHCHVQISGHQITFLRQWGYLSSFPFISRTLLRTFSLEQRTRKGDFEVTLGTMQVINEGFFLHLIKAELLQKGLVITVSSYVSDQPRISLYLVRTLCLPQSWSMRLGLTQLVSKVNMLWSYLK